MNKEDFLNKLKEHIGKTANKKSSEITANAIYFIFKQNSVIKGKKGTYVKILKEIKTFLITDFDWKMTEVHACFCRLSRLLEYC